MKTRQLLFLLALAGVAAAGLNCAPVDAPIPDLEEGKRRLPDSEIGQTDLPFPKLTTERTQTFLRSAPRDPLEQRIDAAIAQVQRRDLLTTNGFWTVFHGILGLGPTVPLLNPATGERINALDYVFSGGEVRGMRFVPTADGLDVETRPGTFISQGHQDQFVAEMVQWGVSPDRIHSEIFSGGPSLTPGVVGARARSPHPPADPQGTGPLVTFARSGLTVRWRPSKEQSLLELAEACDVPVRWSCRTGVCHNCESGLISGSVAYEPDPLDPPAEGNVLICCSRPQGDVVIDI